MIRIVGLLSREIAACSSMSWPNASPRKDPVSESSNIVLHPVEGVAHQVYTVQGADRERQGGKENLHLAGRIPARLMSEEAYLLYS